jgi:hypothetical protein
MLGNGLVQITLTITESDLKDFDRACSVEAQKKRHAPKRGEVFVKAVSSYLDKYDPVRRAERINKKSALALAAAGPGLSKPAVSRPNAVRTEYKNVTKTSQAPARSREPLTAAQLNAVHNRDHGKCTHINELGVRCGQDRWTEIHHVVPVSKGGSNEITNLTTLCSFHHDLAHQLTLPLEGQITWLRSPRQVYGVAPR